MKKIEKAVQQGKGKKIMKWRKAFKNHVFYTQNLSRGGGSLNSHGMNDNQLTLWKCPFMTRIAELEAHTSRVLSSPYVYTVASAAADGALRFWKAFGSAEAA
ncbi:unnamed protein product [Coffea canephora]|uniref:Uncharacterized protein n=1 Tax=Coffea canephora TaxID=49390 RepID=A0A068V9W8_COFCA|nr:unnamed protein product [Coffea canephora]